MLHLVATDHAVQRTRQRLNWNRASLERMLTRVVYAGLGVEDCNGALRRFLVQLPHDAGRHCVRVYGEHVFLFARHDEGRTLSLVTVYAVPPAHRAAARRHQRQQLALAA